MTSFSRTLFSNAGIPLNKLVIGKPAKQVDGEQIEKAIIRLVLTAALISLEWLYPRQPLQFLPQAGCPQWLASRSCMVAGGETERPK
jgi:hypothetical protein